MTNQQGAPEALAHELFTAAQLAPGEGISDAVARIAALVEAQQPAPSAAADLIAALEEARSAINSMKVEAETAGQGDEQMMLEACETISNEGLQADMAIRAPLSDDTDRLNWLLWELPGDALRYVVGELADTSSGAEFRAAIDAAIAAQGGKV